MQIVLIGYMGSGKSTVGKYLSKILKIRFLDLDYFMEDKLCMSVSEIFSTKGEIFFRKFETQCLEEIFKNENSFVLATGGGTPCYGINMNIIQQHTNLLFYLKVSIGELVNRLSKEKEQRPLINTIDDDALPEFIGKHLFERSFFYSKASHTILTDKFTAKEVAEQVVKLI